MRVEGDTIKFNLPHAEHMIGFQPDGAFRIQQGAGFVSVVDLGGGRLLLKAGYHRSFAFARAAMNDPDAKDRCELVALTTSLPPPLVANFPTHQGLRTMVFGSRPPLFSDFFDADLADSLSVALLAAKAQNITLTWNDPKYATGRCEAGVVITSV